MIDSIDEEKFESTTSQQLNASTLSEGEALIEVDPQYFRPTEVEFLLGDAEKAKQNIGWEPEYSIDELVEDMVEGDLKKI